jgi:hypothetical protein
MRKTAKLTAYLTPAILNQELAASLKLGIYLYHVKRQLHEKS